MNREWVVPGVVVSVHDGDTATVDLDLGWHITLRAAVRVAHMNAPELSAPGGVESRTAARQLLPEGREVTVTSHGLDKYGRVLGTITVLSPTTAPFDFAQTMISWGQAVAYEGGPR